MLTPHRPFVALIVATSLVATACADSDDPVPGSASPGEQVSQDFNASDVTFSQGMIPHHAQAVEMALLALAPDRGVAPEVRDLAERIKSAQDPEIEQMTEWLTSRGEPVDMVSMEGMEMDGMAASDDLDDLAALDGAEFDTEWVRLMIAHHEGAIAMAEQEIETGLNDDVLTLAENIITAQEAEIAEMR